MSGRRRVMHARPASAVRRREAIRAALEFVAYVTVLLLLTVVFPGLAGGRVRP